jgi:hypothetical protein
MLLGLFPEVKPPRPDVDDPSPFKSKVELSKATPAVCLMACCREIFTFTSCDIKENFVLDVI